MIFGTKQKHLAFETVQELKHSVEDFADIAVSLKKSEYKGEGAEMLGKKWRPPLTSSERKVTFCVIITMHTILEDIGIGLTLVAAKARPTEFLV